METFFVRLNRETKDEKSHVISATVDQFSGGLYVGGGSTPQAAFEDMFNKLVQAFKERGVNPGQRKIKIYVCGLRDVIGCMYDKDGLSEEVFKERLIKEL